MIANKAFTPKWAQPDYKRNIGFRIYWLLLFLVLVIAFVLSMLVVNTMAADSIIKFDARSRDRVADADGNFADIHTPTEWIAKQTTVIICDMWDKHWCNGATKRVGEMIPKMNTFIDTLREQGVFIIHAPSSTLDYYKDTPQRKAAISAPKVEPPVPIQGWCHLEPSFEIALPIDDSDEGCDDDPPSKPHGAWKSQHPDIHIAEGDAISDIGEEIYNLIALHDIENVIIVGVHTNMCVLGRPFGIRQMTKLGLNVVLVRDLTDAMYNPNMPPYVSHDEGTQLVVQHIEKYWAPSVEANDMLKEFQ